MWMFNWILNAVFALAAAAGWWAFFNQKKVNSALVAVSNPFRGQAAIQAKSSAAPAASSVAAPKP